MIEIAGTLSRDCKLLILDEPTAALSPGETDLLVQHLNRCKARGVGIVVISHRLDEIQAWTDRVTILRDGCRVGTYQTDSLTQPQMIQGMTTGSISGLATKTEAKADVDVNDLLGPSRSAPLKPRAAPIVLKVHNFTHLPAVSDVSFEVARGEVLGIGGLVGSGRTELLRLIFGAEQAQSGRLEIGGKHFAPFRSTRGAVQQGIVMVSEDRKADGLLLTQSITDNIILSTLASPEAISPELRLRNRLGVTFSRAATQAAQRLREQLRIQCHSLAQTAATLSGGNQQKVVLAKWMLRGGEVFLLDEPTRGIDAAAREQVYALIRTLAASGKGIVLVSSDLEELMQLSDRIGVLSAGRWIREFPRQGFDRGELLEAMFAGYLHRKQAVPK